jgi:hypothetical protein
MNSYNNAVLTMFVAAIWTCSQDGIGLVVGASYPVIVAPIFCTKKDHACLVHRLRYGYGLNVKPTRDCL